MIPADRGPRRIVPPRLAPGDLVRVVAPSTSRAHVMEHDNSRWIDERFAAMGLRVDFGAHVDERDVFDSTSVEARVDDLHAAFADPAVAGIMTAIGGYNANELLPRLDWDLIASHPKVLCGYSDITVLQAAIWARAGLVTYSGPHWSSFGMRDHFEPTGDWFRAAVMSDEPTALAASEAWTDDAWFADQDDRRPVPNPGWQVLQPGHAEGTIVGGNLCTLNLLQGTPFMPSLRDTVLFVEDDALVGPEEFARNLTSLLQLPDADGVRALVVGRFQQESAVRDDHLRELVRRQPVLAGRPVVAGADFGHTFPLLTFPIGGIATVDADGSARLVIRSH